jgi:predicted TPR repeat methyltransferase
MHIIKEPLHLGEPDFRFLLEKLGPSLGLWRAAEIAALREQTYEPPVLDLGCGDGLITSRVLTRVDMGLDPDRAALERAAQLGIYRSMLAAPAGAAELPAGSLGTVVSNSVLEHIPDLDETLAAVAAALRPGGRLIFTTPAEAFNAWLTLPMPNYAAWRNRHFSHLHILSLAAWTERLKQVGMEVEAVRPYLRRGWVTAWDVLELAQMVHIRRRRLAGMAWRKLPPAWLDRLARRAAAIDLSSPEPGGGRLIAARKR